MLTCVVLLALFASVQGRAVNISNTWVLPEEGFPVFYRYFRDRISWYEADAVCQFHHANLVTVDTTAQYDAVRAYLKELDISSAVWVGLIRSNPDGDFTWTDYRGLSGDGYWSSAPDQRASPLCAAADPAADYRWEARACGGPTVASFICELPVPQWALGNEGCMVRELPALTILYLPESAAVQLTADCGLAGVKRVQCTGNVKRENLLKDLSCNDDVELSSTTSPMLGGNTSDFTVNNITDLETTEITTEEDITTEHETRSTQVTPSPTPMQEKLPVKLKPVNKLNYVFAQNKLNLDLIHNNNLQSNDIPKLANTENFLTLEQSEKLEDEKHMHHKMLHDELAKHGNFETIFTQPTDHFVPPLVMAKSKMNDDMTVLSLAEKHAQQLAEQGFAKHNYLDDRKDHINLNDNKSNTKPKIEGSSKSEVIDKPIIITLQPIKSKDSVKKDKFKSLPKKYNEKYEDPKGRNIKIDGKLLKFDIITEKLEPMTDATTQITDTTIKNKTIVEDSMELTVMLKEPSSNVKNKSQLFNDSFEVQSDDNKVDKVVTTENIVTVSSVKVTPNFIHDTTKTVITENSTPVAESTTQAISELTAVTTERATTHVASHTETQHKQNITLNHKIIKITIINEVDKMNPTEKVFEVTTLVPEFKDAVNNNKLDHSTVPEQSFVTKNISSLHFSVSTITTPEAIVTPVVTATNMKTETLLKNKEAPTSEAIGAIEKVTEAAITTNLDKNQTKDEIPVVSTTNIPFTTTKEKAEGFNLTEIYEDEGRNVTDSEAIDDLNSPLLSAANEPLHRPNRSRRPQSPPRLNKFNPFRILG